MYRLYRFWVENKAEGEWKFLFWKLILDILEMKSLRSFEQINGAFYCKCLSFEGHSPCFPCCYDSWVQGVGSCVDVCSVGEAVHRPRHRLSWMWALFDCQASSHWAPTTTTTIHPPLCMCQALCTPHWSELSNTHMTGRAQNTDTGVKALFDCFFFVSLCFHVFLCLSLFVMILSNKIKTRIKTNTVLTCSVIPLHEPKCLIQWTCAHYYYKKCT